MNRPQLHAARQQPNYRRPSPSARGYTTRWQKIRLTVLNEEPLCRECAKTGRVTAAGEVDHIDGHVENMERDNLQPLCKPCHSRKTAREDGSFGR